MVPNTNRLSLNFITQPKTALMRVRAIDGNKGGYITMRPDKYIASFRIDFGEGANKGAFSDHWLAINPDQRMKAVLPE